MKIDDLAQSKLLKESKNLNKNSNKNLDINNNDNKVFEEELIENKNIKLNKIIKLKNKDELNNIIYELQKLQQNQNEIQNLDDSLIMHRLKKKYFLIII